MSRRARKGVPPEGSRRVRLPGVFEGLRRRRPVRVVGFRAVRARFDGRSLRRALPARRRRRVRVAAARRSNARRGVRRRRVRRGLRTSGRRHRHVRYGALRLRARALRGFGVLSQRDARPGRVVAGQERLVRGPVHEQRRRRLLRRKRRHEPRVRLPGRAYLRSADSPWRERSRGDAAAATRSETGARLRYHARDGGRALRRGRQDALRERRPRLRRMRLQPRAGLARRRVRRPRADLRERLSRRSPRADERLGARGGLGVFLRGRLGRRLAQGGRRVLRRDRRLRDFRRRLVPLRRGPGRAARLFRGTVAAQGLGKMPPRRRDKTRRRRGFQPRTNERERRRRLRVPTRRPRRIRGLRRRGRGRNDDIPAQRRARRDYRSVRVPDAGPVHEAGRGHGARRRARDGGAD